MRGSRQGVHSQHERGKEGSKGGGFSEVLGEKEDGEVGRLGSKVAAQRRTEDLTLETNLGFFNLPISTSACSSSGVETRALVSSSSEDRKSTW